MSKVEFKLKVDDSRTIKRKTTKTDGGRQGDRKHRSRGLADKSCDSLLGSRATSLKRFLIWKRIMLVTREMLIGVDVGGTFTDGVLFCEGSVVHCVKHPTDERDLTGTLLCVLDELLAHSKGGSVKRIVLSTTLVTNLLASNRGERTALLLLPGSGLPFSSYHISPDTYFLNGSIDFRGREVEEPDGEQIESVLGEIDRLGIRRVAVAGKFSNRSDRHERLVRGMIQRGYPHMEVCTSNEVSGRLNFPRRAVTCYYTAMTMKEWCGFADAIEAAVATRAPGCELHMLKADGGTMPLAASRVRPCETVFSGPAASTMGGAALSPEPLNSLVIDVGGTTSDISLLIQGQPLYASKGALIRGHLTHVHSFAVNSIAMGGDSLLFPKSNDSPESFDLGIGPMRIGPAACFGGTAPTVIDAFNLLSGLGLGDVAASQTHLEALAGKLGEPVEALCRRVCDRVMGALTDAIGEMFRQWEDEPAYKVWEVVNRKSFTLQNVIGIGAAAPAIVPILAQKLGVGCVIHRHSPVANALGAALARPTLAIMVHVDTQSNVYTVSPGGLSGRITGRDYQMEDARKLAAGMLAKIGAERGLSAYADEAQVFLDEQFNVIRGHSLAGKLFNVGVQITPGFVHGYEGVR
jgi:N-methylhydantoinase A/oxoprolinase/acetone carboxylase beta subunit